MIVSAIHRPSFTFNTMCIVYESMDYGVDFIAESTTHRGLYRPRKSWTTLHV